MKTVRSGGERSLAIRTLFIQAAVLVLGAPAVFAMDAGAGLAVMVGGSIAMAANGWMILVLFRPRASSSPRSLVLSLYVGELGKYLFVMAFFALAFKRLEVLGEPRNALLVFVAFVLVQAVLWLWPWLNRGEPAATNDRATKE